MKWIFAAAALLLAAGCDRMIHREPPPVYAPWEEGLTLVYANPSQPAFERQQMRVKSSTLTPQGRVVVETFSNLSGQSEITVTQKNGMEAMKREGQEDFVLFPEGFPDRVSRWTDSRGVLFSVIGRARVDLPGVKLPDPDATGIWIEWVAPFPGSMPNRTLLVPDYGEVETITLKNGKWVTVNRLVSQGFTDLPTAGSPQ